MIERVGGREEIPVDVRIVCATHRDLKAQIQAGAFREDLYYRLAEIVIEIPPLRDRDGDATYLAHAFAQRFAKDNGRRTPMISDDALSAIEAHRWPGNVRELENCIKRAVIMADGDCITAVDLGLAVADEDLSIFNLRHVREEAERTAVLKVIARTNGNIARAAEILGVSRPSLYDLLGRFGLKKENAS
jgi:two-component system NtrC family response regulator